MLVRAALVAVGLIVFGAVLYVVAEHIPHEPPEETP